ncbi:MAG: hypothetical protein AAF539_10055 [Planctomycetota bacterium]
MRCHLLLLGITFVAMNLGFQQSSFAQGSSSLGYGFGPPQSNGFYGGLSNELLKGNHPSREPNYISPPSSNRRVYRYPVDRSPRFFYRRPNFGFGYGGVPVYGVPYQVIPFQANPFQPGIQVFPGGVTQGWAPVYGPRF